MVMKDLLAMMMQTGKVDSIGVEFATILVRKAAILAESKYILHIKTSMGFVSKVVAKFRNVGVADEGSHTVEIDWPEPSRPGAGRAGEEIR